jgi:hypothetical protein
MAALPATAAAPSFRHAYSQTDFSDDDVSVCTTESQYKHPMQEKKYCCDKGRYNELSDYDEDDSDSVFSDDTPLEDMFGNLKKATRTMIHFYDYGLIDLLEKYRIVIHCCFKNNIKSSYGTIRSTMQKRLYAADPADPNSYRSLKTKERKLINDPEFNFDTDSDKYLEDDWDTYDTDDTPDPNMAFQSFKYLIEQKIIMPDGDMVLNFIVFTLMASDIRKQQILMLIKHTSLDILNNYRKHLYEFSFDDYESGYVNVSEDECKTSLLIKYYNETYMPDEKIVDAFIEREVDVTQIFRAMGEDGESENHKLMRRKITFLHCAAMNLSKKYVQYALDRHLLDGSFDGMNTIMCLLHRYRFTKDEKTIRTVIHIIGMLIYAQAQPINVCHIDSFGCKIMDYVHYYGWANIPLKNGQMFGEFLSKMKSTRGEPIFVRTGKNPLYKAESDRNDLITNAFSKSDSPENIHLQMLFVNRYEKNQDSIRFLFGGLRAMKETHGYDFLATEKVDNIELKSKYFAWGYWSLYLNEVAHAKEQTETEKALADIAEAYAQEHAQAHAQAQAQAGDKRKRDQQ